MPAAYIQVEGDGMTEKREFRCITGHSVSDAERGLSSVPRMGRAGPKDTQDQLFGFCDTMYPAFKKKLFALLPGENLFGFYTPSKLILRSVHVLIRVS